MGKYREELQRDHAQEDKDWEEYYRLKAEVEDIRRRMEETLARTSTGSVSGTNCKSVK